MIEQDIGQTPLERVLELIEGVKEEKGGYKGLCPAHADSDPSLSIKEGGDGQVLLKCHAGCETKDVLEEIGLDWSDLFPSPSAGQRNYRGRKELTASYEIRDLEGALQAYHLRYETADGKEFAWQRADGKTFGLNGRPSRTLPLYGSELVPSWPEGASVVLVEGEKAADALRAVGIRALATVTGAQGTPSPEVLEILQGRAVCIWSDNDSEGRDHMRRVAEQLQGFAEEVRFFEWEDAPDKGDAADHPAVLSRSVPELATLRRLLASAPLWGDSKPVSGELGVETALASGVKPEEVRWLWDRRIPFGKLTIFDGDPDQGKSVVTMDISARVSTGRDFPDGARCEAANVAVVNVEDGAGDTVVPRLMAHGGDLDRIHIVGGVPDGKGGTRLLDIPGDVAVLERFVATHEIKVLIIDPVLTMLGGDANKDQDARKALTPLRDMAERTGCAVVAVRHLNKSVGLKAIQRGGGNMGLIGVARAGAFFATDPEDEARRIMAQHKSNLADKAPSLVYRIVSAEVVHQGVTINGVARIEWLGTSEYDANGLAADVSTPQEKSELDEAKEFLRDELLAGPMWVKQVLKDARDANIAEKTLRRAKEVLRVKSDKIGVEGWSWSLPESEGTGNGLQKGSQHAKPERGQEHGHDNTPGYLGHLDHLDHLQINKGNTASEPDEKVEHGQHGQHGQHGHAGSDEHLPLEGGSVAPGHKRGLTAEEAEEVKRLIREGIKPELAASRSAGGEVLRG